MDLGRLKQVVDGYVKIVWRRVMEQIILKTRMLMRADILQQERQRIQKELKEGLTILDPTFEVEFVPSEWVRCKTILPEEYRDIIFCDSKGIEYIGMIDGLKRFIDRSGEKIEDVVAWMPAPLPFNQ